MPLTRLELHHANFEEFLSTLGKATRKRFAPQVPESGTRAKDRHGSRRRHLRRISMRFIRFNLAVHERSPLKFETLTKDYFCRLSREMPERARYFLWRQNDRIIALVSLSCTTTPFTMNVSAWTTASPSNFLFIFTRYATSSRGRSSSV